MKDIVKVALGVVLGIAVCTAIALPVKGYYTVSRYEKCMAVCVEEHGEYLFLLPVDKYVELMVGVEDEMCPKECRGTWTLLDEFHWFMGITYR